MNQYISKHEYEHLKKFTKYSPIVYYIFINIYNINKHIIDEKSNVPANLECESYFEHNMLQYLTMYDASKNDTYSYNYKIFHDKYSKYILYLRDKKMLQGKNILNNLQFLQFDCMRNHTNQVKMSYLHLSTYVLTKLGDVHNNITIDDYIEFFNVFRDVDNFWENINIPKLITKECEKNFKPAFETVFSSSVSNIVKLYKQSNPCNTLISTDISNRYPLVQINNKMLPITKSYKALKYSLFYYYKDNLCNDDYSKIGKIYEEYICNALSCDKMNSIQKNKLIHKSSGKELYDYVLYDGEVIVFFEIKFNLTNQNSKRFQGRNDMLLKAKEQLKDEKKFAILCQKEISLEQKKKYYVCVSFEEYFYEENNVDINELGIILLNTEELLNIVFRLPGGFSSYIKSIENGTLQNKEIIPERLLLPNDRLFDYFDLDFLND